MNVYTQSTIPPTRLITGTDAERLALSPQTYDVFLCADTNIWYRWNFAWGVIARNAVPVAVPIPANRGFDIGFDQLGFH